MLVSAGSPVLGHLSWVTCPGSFVIASLVLGVLVDLGGKKYFNSLYFTLQSNESNIFMTRMHATGFSRHSARRFESQPNASTLLCSRWLSNGTQSGRGDAARPWLPFSDVVASARVRAPQEDFSHNQMLRRYYTHGGLPMVHRVGAVTRPDNCYRSQTWLPVRACTRRRK